MNITLLGQGFEATSQNSVGNKLIKFFADKNFQVGIIIRDSNFVRSLKKLYENSCQLCGINLQIGKNLYYSEVHHIKPLGLPTMVRTNKEI